jgi:hypothetical protein
MCHGSICDVDQSAYTTQAASLHKRRLHMAKNKDKKKEKQNKKAKKAK